MCQLASFIECYKPEFDFAVHHLKQLSNVETCFSLSPDISEFRFPEQGSNLGTEKSLLLQGQTSAPNSGMVSPAKSEFSDDQDFSQSVSGEAMQKQLDWLLAKLMAAETASTTVDGADAVINGSDTLGSVAPRPTSAAAPSSDQHVNGVRQGAESAEMPIDLNANTHHSVESLTEHISQLQSGLATSQEEAEEADALRRQVSELKQRLEEVQDQTQEVDSLRQQLADTQAHSASSPPSTAALQADEHAPAKTEALQEQITQLESELAHAQQQLSQQDAVREELLLVQAELATAKASPSQTASFQDPSSQLQAGLAPVQEQPQQPEVLQAQPADVETSLDSTEESAADAEPLKQQLVQLQADLHSSQARAAALEQQLEDAKAQASSIPSQAEMPCPLSPSPSLQQSGQQNMEQPSASMTTAEADLVEAASNAIEAQVGTTLLLRHVISWASFSV